LVNGHAGKGGTGRPELLLLNPSGKENLRRLGNGARTRWVIRFLEEEFFEEGDVHVEYENRRKKQTQTEEEGNKLGKISRRAKFGSLNETHTSLSSSGSGKGQDMSGKWPTGKRRTVWAARRKGRRRGRHLA